VKHRTCIIGNGKSINYLDGPIFKHDIGDFENFILLNGCKVIGDLEWSAFLFSQLHLYTMLMRDYVLFVFKILEKISRGRLVGHQYIHYFLRCGLGHAAIKQINHVTTPEK
jgi:hypothetical protein